VLAAAERFVTAVRAAFPEPTDETEEDPPDDAVWVDPVHVPRPWVEDFAARDRDAVAAYVGLDNWCHPLIAMATRDRPLLVRLAGDAAFQSALAPASEASGGAGWLANLLQVPMHETLEFVDVRSGRAFELLADGVASNFELHTLLAAALAPPLGHAPPGRLVLDCLAGRGPQSSNAPSEGFWNLYIWHAAAVPPGALRSAPHDLWIWNEGKPADIPRFENRRVVLAGEAAYPRSWSTSRSYGALYPRIDLVRELPPDEARERIARLRAEATTLRPELAKPPEPAREDVRPDPPSRAEEKGGTLGRLLKRIGLGRG
jgi:hypothetical protein